MTARLPRMRLETTAIIRRASGDWFKDCLMAACRSGPGVGVRAQGGKLVVLCRDRTRSN